MALCVDTKEDATVKWAAQVFQQAVTGITSRNVSDRCCSWLDTYRRRRQKKLSLLIGTNRQREKAYWKVVKRVR